MKQAHTIAFSFLLKDLLPAGLDKEVVQQALHYRDGVEKHFAARRNFDALIRRKLRVPGFMHADKARATSLLRPVEKYWLHDSVLGEAVVRLWIEARSDLREAAQDFLEREEIFVPSLGEESEQGEITIPLSRVRELAERFIETEAHFSLDESALMLCRLLPSLPLLTEAVVTDKRPDRESESDAGMNTADGNRLLEAWEALPADAPEWDAVEEFIGALRLLAEEKRYTREAGLRELRAALEQLRTDFSEQLVSFGASDAPNWFAEGCTSPEAMRLAAQIRQLHAELTRLRDLETQPISNLEARKQRRAAIDALEDKIIADSTALSDAFRLVPPPDTPGTGPKANAASPPDDSDDIPQSEAFFLQEAGEDLFSAPPIEEETADSEDAGAGAETVEAAPVRLSDAPEPDFLSTVPDVALPLTFGMGERERRSASDDEEAATTELCPVVETISLRPAAEVAAELCERDADSLWASFQWALIAENDLPGAYWLARSREAAERPCPIPDWLLAAVQGAEWLTYDSVGIATDLMQITQDRLPGSDRTQQMLGLAAALRGALLLPDSGFVGWLHAPEGCAELPEIVAAVADYAKYHRPLRPEDMSVAMAPEQRNEAIHNASRAAANWREDHRKARSIKRARDVWERLMKDILLPLLDPAAADQRGEATRLLETARSYERREEAARLVTEASRTVHPRKEMGLAGVHREQLVRDVQEAALLTRRWCERVEQSKDSVSQSDRIAERAIRLRDTIRRALPGAETALEAMCRSAQPESVAASAACLRRALHRLTQMLEAEETDANTRSNRTWWTPAADGDELRLMAALNRRLLLLTEVAREGDGLPTPAGLAEVAPALRHACTEGRTLAMALSQWIRIGDFRFTRPLLTALAEEPDGEQRITEHENTLLLRRSELNGDIEGTRTKIERALIDGILTDEERAELLAPVVSDETAATENFPRQARLLQDIRDQIEAARRRRLETQSRLWQELQASMGGRVEAETWKRVRACIEADFERGEPRVVDERLSHLRDARDKGIEPDIRAFSPESLPERRELEEFQKAAPRILESLDTDAGLNGVLRAVAGRRTWANVLSFGSVPPPRLNEAEQGLESWKSLKKKHPKAAEAPDLIEQILRYLGFSFPPDGRPYVRTKQAGNDWLTVQAHVSAGNLSRPIPQFGSQARGRYDILCLWERPGTEAISARLHELRLEGDNLLVLYLGRLKQRQDLVRLTRSRDLALALLDESLMAFLAAEKDARLRTFLRCSLPYAAVNPYTPDKAGAVPDEMFFGREEAARELMNPDGSCLVYGGRQLGKSALLVHVQRQFENPEREQFAWVEDIKRVGDPL